jgi:hypothetical protein
MKVMIKCPETSHAVFTGIEVDYDLASVLDVAYHAHCPLCGNTHVWWKQDAWLANGLYEEARSAAA